MRRTEWGVAATAGDSRPAPLIPCQGHHNLAALALKTPKRRARMLHKLEAFPGWFETKTRRIGVPRHERYGHCLHTWMVILVSDERTASAAGQRQRQGTDGMVQMGTGGTNADANHPCRQADSRRFTAGIARLPIQSSENTGRIWRK